MTHPESLDSLQARLAPSHLIPTDNQEAKESMEKSLEIEDPEEKKAIAEKANPRSQREYTFKFDWEDGRGKHWRGTFTNTILTIHQRQLSGILRARLSSNTPQVALDVITDNINTIIAHLTYSLTQKPKWANNLLQMTDMALLQALYKEVLAHEDFFHGYDEAEEESQAES